MSEAKNTTTMPKDFGFGNEEELLRDMARRLLRDEIPVEKLRQLVAPDPDKTYTRGERPDWDESLWKQCIELGWTGLAVPEKLGGVGLSLVGIAGLVEEVGRAAFPSPLLSTLAASFVLSEAGTPEANALLERIAAGASVSLAITDETGSWEAASCDVEHAASRGGGSTLTGRAYYVQDAFKADAFVVLSKGSDGYRLSIVESGQAGLEVAQDHIHDLTRDQATLSFGDVVVEAPAEVSLDAAAVIYRAWPAILVIVSADLVGTSEWQLQTTTEYAKMRKQFDRPIGFFQAVKHPLSNGMVKIDRARSLVYHAACCVDYGSEDASEAARMAKSAASDAGRFLSDRSVQLHGGIGFTWECDVHIYFKRSMHNQSLYGDGFYQRSKLAEKMIGPIAV